MINNLRLAILCSIAHTPHQTLHTRFLPPQRIHGLLCSFEHGRTLDDSLFLC